MASLQRQPSAGAFRNAGASLRLLAQRVRSQTATALQDMFWRVNRSGEFRHAFEQAVTHMAQGVCLYDSNDRLRLANAQFSRIYNQPLETLRVGMTFKEMLTASIATGNYPGRTVDEIWTARKAFIDKREPGTFIQELGDGRLISIAHQPLESGGWVATYEDITARRRAELQVQFMAHHDTLTQLPNRALLAEKLETAMAKAELGIPCVLLCLDLDGFKRVNDSLGHAAGDRLLREVAARLRLGLRDGDIAARLGGDEFAVLLPDTQAATANRIAERLNASLTRAYFLGPEEAAHVGASIGIACAPDHAVTADALMSHADRALYAAKRSRRGVPRLYDPDMLREGPVAITAGDSWHSAMPAALKELRAATSMAEDLRMALLSGHLHLHYQPIVSGATHAPIAYEALSRWTDPTVGSISPTTFIAVAEETGLIMPLTEWVLRRACLDASTWPTPHPVTVNMSSLTFGQPDLAGSIAAILADTRLPPERLILELTETTLLNDTATVRRSIEALRALGVRIWLDDFGTGYANFALLHSLPFSAIKIDRSFLAESPRRETILAGIVRFGHACGFSVVAEGIETIEQQELLVAVGCDHLQGFLLGHPAPMEDLLGSAGASSVCLDEQRPVEVERSASAFDTPG